MNFRRKHDIGPPFSKSFGEKLVDSTATACAVEEGNAVVERRPDQPNGVRPSASFGQPEAAAAPAA